MDAHPAATTAPAPAATTALRVVGPRDRPPAPFPRWLLWLLGAGAALTLLARAIGDLDALSAAGHALGIAASCAIGMWAEHRVYRFGAAGPGWRRLLLELVLPWAALVAGVLLGTLADALLAPVGLRGFAAATVILGCVWFAFAGFGTACVAAIDRAVSLVSASFRTRLVLAVLLLVGVSAVAAMGLVAGASALVEGMRDGSVHNISVDLGAGHDPHATKLLLAWIDAHPTRAVLVLYAVGLLLHLPGLLSACGKLADAVMERVEPLTLAMEAVAGGDRDLEVERGGSAEFESAARSFNAMVAALRLGEKMERAFGIYVSAKVRDAIKRQHGDALIPATQREATVLFADIRGFTALSERLTPAMVAALLNRYFERVVEHVDAWDGYLDKFIGDAVVVVWNAPVEQPDHAERAVRCALAIQATVAEMNRAGAFAEAGTLKVGIGIATGQMVCGNIGSPRQMEYTVIGDTVNLAARYCGHAPADEVWVSERTVEALSAAIAREALAPMHVKGKSIPVVPYRVGAAAPIAAG